MFLTSIITTVLVKTASMAYRVGHEEIQRGSVEARALVVLKELREDLVSTSPAAITLTTSGSQMVCQPIEEVLPSGTVMYEEKFIHWSREDTDPDQPGKLTRMEILARPDSQAFDGNPFRWTPDQMAALDPGAGDRTALSFEGVTLFTVKNLSEVSLPQVGSLLGCELEIVLPIATTRRTIRVTDAVQVRNGGGG